MKKRFFASLVTVMVSVMTVYIYAGTIKGKVLDSTTHDPIEFVNITIRKVGTTKPLPLGEVTDSTGVFSLKDISAGKYIVKASFVGYTAVLKNAVVAENASNIDLGTISLSEDSKVLGEVEVVGMKSQMRFDLDKKVFNVDQNIASAGASASEVLETIPSVEVDNDGEVSLRGNSSVAVWINGKPSGLSSDNRAQILEQLPAETIEKVEVITNPSAKYSPEGTAGIINIVLKQNRQAGYFGSAQAGANTQGGFNVGGNINFNIGKWDSYFNIGVRSRHRSGIDNSYRDYTDKTFLYSNGENERRNSNVFLRLGTTYNATKNDAISLNGFLMLGKGWENNYTQYLCSVPNSFCKGFSDSRNDRKNRGGNVDLGYTHKFGENHSIDATVAFNAWRMPSDALYHRKYDYGDEVTTSWQSQDSKIHVNNWDFQLDYVNQFSKKFKIEAGYKGTLSYEDSPVTTYSGTEETNMDIDENLYNRFIYNQNTQALYAAFGGKIEKFNFQTGLRGEYWHNEGKSLAYGQEENDIEPFVTDKFALFPSAFAAYSLPQDNEIQINYTRRIQRPWGGQLNSFVNITDPTNISYGNPHLLPQYSNAYEINYIKTWTSHMLSVCGYYRTTNDVIQRISFMKDGVMNNTSDNVSKSQSSGAEIVLKDKFFKRLDITTTANLYYYKLDGFSYLPEGAVTPVIGDAQSNFSWNVRIMASIMLPWGLNFQANGSYNAKEIVAQGYRKPQYRVDAGIKKNLGNWSFSANVRDMFDSRQWHTITTGPTYTQDSKHKGGGRRFQFTVSYSFGNAKAKRNQRNKQQDEGTQSGYDMGGEE